MLGRLSALSIGLSLLVASVHAEAAGVEDVMPPTAVTGNLNVFATQVAYDKGTIYTVNVEPAAGVATGINLRTVVRQGKQVSGVWRWTSAVVESRTMDDNYHTQPSIAVDKLGYIHIVYNMHNMPWQYVVSTKPNDITEFTFRGEPVGTAVLSLVKFKSQTPFPSLGSAAIPGTQITYPSFFKDRNGELYVTYRHAVRPKRPFAQREYACGIARYNTSTQLWNALGGKIAVSDADAEQAGTVTAFCSQSGWWGYQPRLWFDKANAMHVSWAWRQGSAGGDCTNLSYAVSTDGGRTFKRSNGEAYTLPIKVYDGESVLPDRSTKVACRSNLSGDATGANPLVSFQYFSKGFAATAKVNGRWTVPLGAPYGGQMISSDEQGGLWAFASAGRVATGTSLSRLPWRLVQQSTGYCVAKVLSVPERKAFIVHTQSCDNTKVKLVWVPWS